MLRCGHEDSIDYSVFRDLYCDAVARETGAEERFVGPGRKIDSANRFNCLAR